MCSGSPGTGTGPAELCPALAATRATAPILGNRNLDGTRTGPRSATPRSRGETAAAQGRNRYEAPRKGLEPVTLEPAAAAAGTRTRVPPAPVFLPGAAEQQRRRVRAPP